MTAQFYIGLMSGTSVDGIDGVLINLASGARFAVLAHRHAAFEPALRQQLLSLNQSGPDELHRSMLAANALALAYADVVSGLLKTSGLQAPGIACIGAHGQTVRHRPGEFDGTGYTCQLLNGALLAERTGIDVACDFRTRDVAAGGQGAPLVPAFHQAAFAAPGQDVAILNLGGIANLSLLHADGRVTGHDCGPGNVLLDVWCTRHTGQPFDAAGAWAAGGRVDDSLLAQMLADPYLQRSPPKSTGRDWYDAHWLDAQLQRHQQRQPLPDARDIQATLAQFTCRTVARDLQAGLPGATKLVVCGGGALNSDLLHRLRLLLPSAAVGPVEDFSSLQAMHVEAAAFAWLAQCLRTGVGASRPAVTGARGPRVLGVLHHR